MSSTSDKPKQTKQTANLANKIRQARERGDIWVKICRDQNIYTPKGEPDTGLAYKIAYEGYEPSHKETRDRLGLREICTACFRAFRSNPTANKPRSQARQWWDRLNTKEKSVRIESMYQDERHDEI